MHITESRVDDGYVERIVSLFGNTTPIFKIRAVRTASGEYISLVRDFNSGACLARGEIRYMNVQDCLRAARNMAVDLILQCVEKEDNNRSDI
jgi:hypothetical protein